jgi:crossover junction endodeoxyribonuclease RuvC
MKLLSIDPGYDRVGVAILEKDIIDRTKEVVLFSSCIQTNKEDSFYERMEQVRNRLHEIIEEYQPDTLVLEELYFAKNTKTAMRVSEARGIIVGEGMRHGLKIFEIHPNRVKIAITGYGAAKKEDILFMLPKLIAMDLSDKIDDEVDALAIGVAFFAEYRG